MNKVILTQEQAEAIKRLIEVEGFTHEQIIKSHSKHPNGWYAINVIKSLNNMDLLTLVDALRIGYEVEPEFKVGDWVVHENGHPIRQVTGFSSNHLEVSDGKDGYIWAKQFVRHATPEEIAEEKERRWWSDRNRKIWELRTRDILINENEDTFEVTNSNPPEGYYSIGYTLFDHDEVKRSFRVLCFAENREDAQV